MGGHHHKQHSLSIHEAMCASNGLFFIYKNANKKAKVLQNQ